MPAMLEERIISRRLLPLLKPTFWRAVRRAQKHSMVSKRRMQNLWRLMWRGVRAGVSGDYVELGTARGGTALLLDAHRRGFPGGAERQVWLYDAFEDFEPCFARYEDVRRLLFDESDCDPEAVHLVRGFFDKGLATRPPRPIAFLHVDAGGYEGVSAGLDLVWPHLSPGAWLVFDNYGVDEGCRRAVDERVPSGLHRFGHTQAYTMTATEA